MSTPIYNSLLFQIRNLNNGMKKTSLKLVQKSINDVIRKPSTCLYSTETTKEKTKFDGGIVEKKTSKAMLAYLERAKQHDDFMEKERNAFEIGKRHLANMMGEDPEHFSQKQIDEAISYLFPSGLYDPGARPVMKPPEEIFPPRKAAEFDETGRPFNSFFYTCRPNYYETLYNFVDQMHKLNKIEDDNFLAGVSPDPEAELNLIGSEWLNFAEFEKKILEKITEDQYEYFLSTANVLCEHPYAHLAKDFIMDYRKEIRAIVDTVELLPLQYMEDGRPYVEVLGCRRRSSWATVRVIGGGTGLITINGKDITYFSGMQEREQVCIPILIFIAKIWILLI